MPTPLPIAGHTDLTTSALFFAKNHADVGMIANFVQPVQTTSLSMSALFWGPGHTDVPSSATFKATTSLAVSATFNNPTSIVSLPMSATFYNQSGTTSLTASALFRAAASLSSSATFYQPTTQNLTSSATFGYAKTLPMSVSFMTSGNTDLRMRGFLGKYSTTLAMTATFMVSSYINFNASIVIQNYVAPKTAIFSASNDLGMSMTVKGPSKADWLMTAWFGGALPNDFPALIRIVNPYYGVPNVPVQAVQTGITPVTATTDVSGYFHIGNLHPGTYLVTPISKTITFIPPSMNVTITNQNVELYFHANGTFADLTLVPVPIPPNPSGNCIVDPNNDTAGTFSIDGFILPGDYLKDYQSIIVTAASEEEAAKFRQTFNRNVGGGF